MFDQAALHRCLDEFDLAWRDAIESDATAPSIAEYLGDDSSALRLECLVHLCCLDLEHRWKRIASRESNEHGNGAKLATVEHYLVEYPVLASQNDSIRPLILAEYRARRSNGVAASIDDFVRRYENFPGLQAELEQANRELVAESVARVSPKLPGYEIEEELGQGGRGVVYKAYQLDLGRYVAIKFLKELVGNDSDSRARFQREAATLAKLKHENIVAVHSISEYEGQPFIVMEWIEGKSLAQIIETEHLPIPDITKYLIQVAGAIEHAHQNGILHRDLKPANILIDPSGNAHVTDFGLAKAIETDADNEATVLTHTKDIVGTPCFMPPEQVDSSKGRIAPTSDVYALGATLYNLLTGRPPLRGSTTWETFQLILDEDPLAPQSLNPKIPTDINTICMHCLEKDARRRYQTVGEVRDELRRYAAGEAVWANPVSGWVYLRRKIVRHPRESALWGGIGLAIILLVAVLGFSSIRYNTLFLKEQKQRLDLETALDRSEENKYISFIQQAYLQYQSHNLKEVSDVLQLAVPLPGEKDRRDWEWYYFQGLVESGEYHFRVEEEETPWIRAISLTSKSNRLAAGSSVPWFESIDQQTRASVRVWDLDSKKVCMSELVPGNAVDDVVISADGKHLAVVAHVVDRDLKTRFDSSLTTLQMYDVDSGKVIWETHEVERNHVALALSDASSTMFSLDINGIRAWDVENGKLLWERPNVVGFQLFEEAIMLRTNAADSWVDLRSGKSTTVFDQDAASVSSYRFARDMERSGQAPSNGRSQGFTRSWDGGLEARNTENQVLVAGKDGASILAELGVDAPGICAFSPDNQHLAISRSNGAIEIWNFARSTLVQRLTAHPARICHLEYSADGARLLSGDWNGNVVVSTVSEVGNASFYGETVGALSPVEAFAISSAGEDVVTIQLNQNEFKRFDLRTANLTAAAALPELLPQFAPGRSASISDNGKLLCITNNEDRKKLDVYKLPANRRIARLEFQQPIQFVTTSTHGGLIGVASWQRKPELADGQGFAEVKVFDCRSMQPIFETRIQGERIWRLSLCEATQRVAASLSNPRLPGAGITDSKSNSVQVWELTHGSMLWKQQLPADSVLCLALSFNSTGTSLATGTLPGLLTLWDGESGKKQIELEGKLEDIEDLCFSRMGSRVCGVNRKQLTMWDSRTGQRILSIASPIASFDPIFNPQVRFSLDGRRLMTNHYDERIRILTADLPEGSLGRLREENSTSTFESKL